MQSFLNQFFVICFHLQIGRSLVTMAAKAKFDTWKNPGVSSSPFVRIFMQITGDLIGQ